MFASGYGPARLENFSLSCFAVTGFAVTGFAVTGFAVTLDRLSGAGVILEFSHIFDHIN
jgi:hypothetical protein